MKKMTALAVALCISILAGCAETKTEEAAPVQTTAIATEAPTTTTTINEELNNLLDEYEAFIEDMKKENERLESILDKGDRVKSEYYKWVSESIDFVKPLLESGAPAKDDLIKQVEAWLESGDVIALEAVSYAGDLFSDLSEDFAALMTKSAEIHRNNYLQTAEQLLDKLRSSHFKTDEIYELYKEIVDIMLTLADPESKAAKEKVAEPSS